MAEKRLVEEELEAYARQRRAEAAEPFEIPPATRQTLLAEVDRLETAPRPVAGGGGAILKGLLPRLGIAIALWVALFVVVWVQFAPDQPEDTLTLAKGIPGEDEQRAAAPSPADSERPEPMTLVPLPLVVEDTSLPRSRAEPAPTAVRREAPAVTQEIRAEAPQASLASTGPRRAREESLARSLPPVTPPAPGSAVADAASRLPTRPTTAPLSAPATLVSPEPMALAEEPSTAAETIARFQRPSTMPSANFNSPPLPPVLEEFTVQTIGDRLQLVDRDGSVYEVAAAGPTAAMVRTGEVFQVSGTNQTLGLPVTFVGNIIAGATTSTPEPVRGVDRFAFGLEPAEAPLQVQGRVTLGTSTRFKVDAVQIPE